MALYYMVGAYLAYQLISIVKINFWLGLLGAAVGAGILGLLMEFLFLRRIYGRYEEGGYQILLTYSFMAPVFGSQPADRGDH
jgi:branched-chain amino acid transport system permease protein